jgi:hypothetical protein
VRPWVRNSSPGSRSSKLLEQSRRACVLIAYGGLASTLSPPSIGITAPVM